MTSCSHGAWRVASEWRIALWWGQRPKEKITSVAWAKLNRETGYGWNWCRERIWGGMIWLEAKNDRVGRVGCRSRVGLLQSKEGNTLERERGKDGMQSSRNPGEGQGSAFLFHSWGFRKPLGWHNLQESGHETPHHWSDIKITQATELFYFLSTYIE